MTRVTKIQLAVTAAALVSVFLFRLTKLPHSSPFELFLLLNILLALVFRPPAALTAIAGGLAGAHALMALEGAVPTRYGTMLLVYLVLSGILFVLNNGWHGARDRAEAERAAHARQRERLLAEAQDANQAKDRLLANVSHELRTPLNAIVGWAAMMTRPDASPDHVRRAAEVIKRNAEALARIVDQLLDVSLANAGRLRSAMTPVPVSATVHAAVESMAPAAAASELTMTCVVADDAGMILGDQPRLQQVLLIVLSNAIKFTGSEGEVAVEARRAGESVTIDVRDTGIGIEPDYLPLVFERFTQADLSTTKAYGGIGLGLSIARDLVESMGGTITVASRGTGHGTTVSMRFPHYAETRAEALT
jgi:signal transduction histidine kinase